MVSLSNSVSSSLYICWLEPTRRYFWFVRFGPLAFSRVKVLFLFWVFWDYSNSKQKAKDEKFWCGRTCITVRRPKNMQKISPQSYETQIKIVALNLSYLNQVLNNPAKELFSGHFRLNPAIYYFLLCSSLNWEEIWNIQDSVWKHLLALLAFLPSVISSFFTQNNGGLGPPPSPLT